ncbi:MULTISPECIES: heavy-metal-associated domain-containing protein [Hyphomicrobiales]|uniref:Heavy-metal-associated domain-containing protein n=1 Tax=Agrobacterium pusense TaxID=648995 RepID=A0AA44EPJ5_9HYPH|nr:MULTISPECIES: heavy-metal-associated domain-containing protein [Hyphomicrobiales]KAB2737357.1 heavy-metal-associated domain-containing protein [Brucella anthropi]NRF11389.1 heavy-metal-associated domain-containing protein [Agrobacterium pusense]NRF22099.1 heavy-metal-associated domain-containing protein [Agrobacterium pusense]CDN96476.1 Copper chaperone [Agrobacterium tumefaciens]
MQFHIQNMTCGGCARSVTKAVQSVDPEAKVAIDLQTRNVDVTSQQPASAFESALAKVGYPALSTTASTAG